MTNIYSKEEIKDILRQEEIDACWKRVENSKRIKEREERRAYWKKANAPFNQPNVTMSDEVNKTKEAYRNNNPIFKELDIIEARAMIWLANMGLVSGGSEESCLSC